MKGTKGAFGCNFVPNISPYKTDRIGQIECETHRSGVKCCEQCCAGLGAPAYTYETFSKLEYETEKVTQVVIGNEEVRNEDRPGWRYVNVILTLSGGWWRV